jgi:cytochrome c oxidase subunit 2
MDLNAELTSVFNLGTEQNRPLVYLHLYDIAICLVIGLLVFALLIWVAVKFRHRPGDNEPYQNPGNVKLEIAWTVIPALILLSLGILTAVVMGIVNPPPGNKQADVVVIGHQWWWEYRYPKTGVVTANELYLPLGANLLFEVRGADVIHSFWVPAFGQKMDAIPGHPNFVWYKPIHAGLFLGQCSEFCGDDHALMRILAMVVPANDFDAWTKRQLAVPAHAGGGTAQRGEQLFMSHSCVQCHTIAGTTAHGDIGPDLTHLAQRRTIGSGVIPNTVGDLSSWIQNPQQFKPGVHMPNMRLSKQDAEAIAVYLESLK